MTSEQIRRKFLDFFKEREHTIVPGTSLVPPPEDKSSLFVSAGVQPLAPYILGKPHPAGRRIVNIQKCVRVQDIDEVGDKTHDTFFEMMGNWSFNDYFKEDAIKWSFELLTDKDKGFGLDPKRLYITVFEGDENAPRDTEAFEIWKKYVPENRIYFMSAKSNWWSAGDNGPSGPDTEMFYDITPEGLGDMTKEEYIKADDEQKVVEIWNNVFMEYLKKDGKVIGKLETRNVDTGSGLERVAMAVQMKDNIFDTDLFAGVIEYINSIRREVHGSFYEMLADEKERVRIIADHLRTILFLVSDGVLPGKSDKQYIVRKLMRRIMLDKGIEKIFPTVLKIFESKYKDTYKEIDADKTINVFKEELDSYKIKLAEAIKEFNKKYVIRRGTFTPKEIITGYDAFYFYSTYGMPKESFVDLFKTYKLTGNIYEISSDFENEYIEKFKEHQNLSSLGSEQKFKGGLGGHSEMEVKYHTATHLLHQALRDVLGKHVEQKGSNITPERLRFDFSHPQKITDEEKKKVEDIVNGKITENLPVKKVMMSKVDAEKSGALHFFGEKYGDEVSVYYIGDSIENAYSKEFCGGPHTENTGVLGTFKILKEEAVSAGVRRIKAVLE